MARDWVKGVVVSLAAAISLLEHTPKAKKAAPSNRMFDQMLLDYKKALEIARSELRQQGKFVHKTYRCEWVTEVYTVDQYGQRQHTAEVWYEKTWPTREEAETDLKRILVPTDNPNRPGNYPGAKHSYYDCGFRYREVECN